MPERSRWRGLSFSVLFLLAATQAHAARLYLDSRPTNLDPTDRYCDLLLRELPRQMLILTAIDELRTEVVDPTLEQGAIAGNGDVRLGLERKQNRDTHVLHIDLLDADNNVIDASDVKYDYLAHGIERVRDLVANMETQNRGKWRGLLKQRLAITQARPQQWDPALPAPAEAQRYLTTVDFHSAYLAARITHRAIAESGESPARLGALVRAYTNLADSTRDLVSGHSAAMFARAYIYAQRLVRLAPDDPASWYHRAYLETVHGMVLDAQADFKRADELASGAAAPSWAELARLMLAYNTVELYKRSDGPEAPLASYFAWRTVEYSGLSGMTINLAKRALQNNPGALRVQNSITWNSSITYATEAPAISGRILNNLLRGLTKSNEAPTAVQEAIAGASEQGFTPKLVQQALASVQAQPRETDEPHLPWAGYVSMVREWHFTQAFMRLSYVDYTPCASPADEIASWWPLVSDHRYAILIASFEKSRRAAGSDTVEKIRAMHFSDDTIGFAALRIGTHLINLGIPLDSPHKTNWADHCVIESDRSATEVAGSLWLYRFAEGAAYSVDRRPNAELLDQLAPDHPVALVWRALEDWPKIEPRAAQIEKELVGNPTVWYALGAGYARSKQYDHAIDLLTRAALYAPDAPVYRQLAEMRLAQKDVDGYLDTWDRYFQVAEDTGLDFAIARNQIALKLLGIKQPAKALPYAAGAAGVIKGGNETYLLTLTQAGLWEQAEGMTLTAADTGVGQYRWCRETGRGDIDRARRDFAANLNTHARHGSGHVTDAAMFCWLEGDPARAAAILEPEVGADVEMCAAHILALIRAEQKRPDEAREILQKRMTLPKVDFKSRCYILAAQQLKRCLEDASSLPSDEGDLAMTLDDPTRAATQGNVYYLFGRVCELNGKTSEARQWYRRSLDALSPNFATRGAAGDALRKLGEEYYK